MAMIRYFQVFGYLVFLLCALTATAQEKVISETEFNVVWKKACEKTKSVSHLHTETNEEYYDDAKPPYHSYISMTRYLPPDRVWTIAGRKDSSAEEKYEEIRIGRKNYSRDGNSPWKFKELGFTGLYDCESTTNTNVGAGNGSGISSDGNQNRIKFEDEYKYMGGQNFGTYLADLYVHIKRMNITNTDYPSQTTFKNSYWIHKNGLFLKTETTTRSANSQRWSRQLREYNYDQKDLKIEAPIK